MKISISKIGLEPMEIDIGEGCYIDLAGNTGMRQRQPVELVTAQGLIGIDMDAGGFVSGIELSAEDSLGHPVWNLIQPSPNIAGPDGKCIVPNQKN